MQSGIYPALGCAKASKRKRIVMTIGVSMVTVTIDLIMGTEIDTLDLLCSGNEYGSR